MKIPFPSKPAQTEHKINELIQKRWSPIAFSPEPIEEEMIKSLFEAARWAPSSFNEQPWRFLYATKQDAEAFEKMSSLLNEGNSWARNAYMLVLVHSAKKFKMNDKPNRHHLYDTGSAVQNLLLQATSMGLIGHPMAGYDKEQSYTSYDLGEEDYESLAIIAIGYPGNEKELDEDQVKRQHSKRERMKLEEFVKKA